ncbi:MAG: hypothetical protein E7441_06445, partial [Ruminococcaceae bacterium]|nr:hypothetical protein [Oscillospiraceae bacterium]
MKKFMKRTGVLLVALCLVASLMPSFALATVVGEVTVDFTTAEITGLKTADCTPPAKVEGEGFAAVESETTTTKGQQTARNFNGVKINLLYIQTAKQSWITHSTPKEAQWTIEVDMKTTEPGWYD